MTSPAPAPGRTTWEKLKRRKIFQWAVAYLGAVWLVVEVRTGAAGRADPVKCYADDVGPWREYLGVLHDRVGRA